jgi:hypothetical protein
VELTGTQKALAAREAELREAAPAAQQLPGAQAEASRLQAQVRELGRCCLLPRARAESLSGIGCTQRLAGPSSTEMHACRRVPAPCHCTDWRTRMGMPSDVWWRS